MRYSVLDLVPIRQGGSVSGAMDAAASLAKQAEALGFTRYWVAEHHAMPGIGGAATSVVLAHVGAATSTIRIGAGGIMLPNHAPLQIAEQFGTLEALYPGRVDLALGRAPGTDQRVARAIRRNLSSDEGQFPRDVVELQAYLAGDERLGFQAVPGAGTHVPLWILGSSLFGAQLAAALGLPFGFASHFAPDALMQALAIYRRDFKPSAQLDKPYALAAMSVFAADTTEQAELIATSMAQSFVALRTGRPGPLPPPLPGYVEGLPMEAAAMLRHMRRYSVAGTGEECAAAITAFAAETGVDEVMITGTMHDPAAALHSLALTAGALGLSRGA